MANAWICATRKARNGPGEDWLANGVKMHQGGANGELGEGVREMVAGNAIHCAFASKIGVASAICTLMKWLNLDHVF